MPLMSGIRRSVITRWNGRSRSAVQGRAAVAGRLDLEAVHLEDHPQVFADQGRVVNHEDARFMDGRPGVKPFKEGSGPWTGADHARRRGAAPARPLRWFNG